MTSDTVKRTLRIDAKKRRDTVADAVGSAAAVAALARKVLALAPNPGPAISAYIAIGSELNPGPLTAKLAALGAIMALPVMTAKAAPLEFRAWTPGSALVERMWGIREPGPDCAIVEPDILLVPLLLVDAAGNRLGYGGGFYDRTLNRLRDRKNIVAIGVAHDIQKVDAVPHEAYDEPLDYLLTPSGLDRF